MQAQFNRRSYMMSVTGTSVDTRYLKLPSGGGADAALSSQRQVNPDEFTTFALSKHTTFLMTDLFSTPSMQAPLMI
jgi:hypothetical protein